MILKPQAQRPHAGMTTKDEQRRLLADYTFDERDGSDTDSEAYPDQGDNGSERPTASTVRPARRNAFASCSLEDDAPNPKPARAADGLDGQGQRGGTLSASCFAEGRRSTP